MLKQMIDQELLVQEARRDTSVSVTEQEVQDAVEQTVQNVRRNFRSEIEFRQQLQLAGFASAEEWRRWLADNQRRQIFAQRLLEVRRQAGQLKPIPPTEEQMREVFEANRGGAQPRPPVVSFRQIVIAAQPDTTARLRARATAESLLVALRGGADFLEAARRLSDDSASAQAGGELGWFRRGVMVKEFERVAFTLRPGELSPIVPTEFGYHIIKVERIQPAEVFARHILIMPDVSVERVAVARALADSIHGWLAAGAGLDTLARRYGDPTEAKLAEDVPLAQLPPEYQTAIGEAARGLIPVFAVGEGSARPKFVVLELTDRQEAGPLRFEDVRDRIRQNLGQQLAVEHYLTQLRRRTYIDVRL
jgi:peptidyl-prolyl cis-trans isomerase SurA